MVCLLATLWVQLSVSAGNGWPHNALRHHWLMPISCHFRDCKALLVTSLTHVSGAISSVQTFNFYLYHDVLFLWHPFYFFLPLETTDNCISVSWCWQSWHQVHTCPFKVNKLQQMSVAVQDTAGFNRGYGFVTFAERQSYESALSQPSLWLEGQLVSVHFPWVTLSYN